MSELLKKLHEEGVDKNSLEEDETILLEKLSSLNLLSKNKNLFKLKDGYALGRVDINRSNLGFLITPLSKQDLLIDRSGLNGALKKDIVVAKIDKKRKRGRLCCIVLSVLVRDRSTLVCRVEKQNGSVTIYDIKSENRVLVDASKKSLKALPEGAILKVNLESAEITEVLGHIDSPLVDEKISLALYNKTETFPKECEMQAEAYGKEVYASLYPDREDLRGLNFYTIDPKTAKDHDDALCYDEKSSILYVAIADVSSYVTPLSALDKEALKRGFSIYLPHKSIPMLPRALSENICSLKEGEDRLAYVCKLHIDRRKKIVKSHEFFEAVINVKRGFTYNYVDEILEDREKLRIHGTNLKKLYKLTSAFRGERMKSGFEFLNHDTRLVLDKNQELLKVEIEEETPSHKLVEECMLLANIAASSHFDYGVFRVHEKPDASKIEDLLGELANIGINPRISSDINKMIVEVQAEAEKLGLREDVDMMIIKAQKQARYDAYNIGHFGLGFDSYSHFTSPIRRYSDLLLHRLLKAILKKNQKDKRFALKNIETINESISTLERESAKVEYDYMDRKFARWAKQNLGQNLKVTVTNVEYPAIATVKEGIVGARVFINDRMDFYLFDRLVVKITEVDLFRAKIYVRVEEIDVSE
ncbi:MAG: ribonuclease R family protein [Campylobacterales bacterium]